MSQHILLVQPSDSNRFQSFYRNMWPDRTMQMGTTQAISDQEKRDVELTEIKASIRRIETQTVDTLNSVWIKIVKLSHIVEEEQYKLNAIDDKIDSQNSAQGTKMANDDHHRQQVDDLKKDIREFKSQINNTVQQLHKEINSQNSAQASSMKTDIPLVILKTKYSWNPGFHEKYIHDTTIEVKENNTLIVSNSENEWKLIFDDVTSQTSNEDDFYGMYPIQVQKTTFEFSGQIGKNKSVITIKERNGTDAWNDLKEIEHNFKK